METLHSRGLEGYKAKYKVELASLECWMSSGTGFSRVADKVLESGGTASNIQY